MKVTYLFLLSLLLGCAMLTTPPDFSRVNVGMAKNEVIDVIGKPDSSSLFKNIEYLKYIAGRGTISKVCFSCKEYYVRLIDNKVDSYGESGDINSREHLNSGSYDEANRVGNTMLRNMQQTQQPIFIPPTQSTQPQTPPVQKIKNTDQNCVSECMKGMKFQYGLCESKCSY